jgi:hypothetical protein
MKNKIFYRFIQKKLKFIEFDAETITVQCFKFLLRSKEKTIAVDIFDADNKCLADSHILRPNDTVEIKRRVQGTNPINAPVHNHEFGPTREEVIRLRAIIEQGLAHWIECGKKKPKPVPKAKGVPVSFLQACNTSDPNAMRDTFGNVVTWGQMTQKTVAHNDEYY